MSIRGCVNQAGGRGDDGGRESHYGIDGSDATIIQIIRQDVILISQRAGSTIDYVTVGLCDTMIYTI